MSKNSHSMVGSGRPAEDGEEAKEAGLPDFGERMMPSTPVEDGASTETVNKFSPKDSNTRSTVEKDEMQVRQHQHTAFPIGKDEFLADISPMPAGQPPVLSQPGAFAQRTLCSASRPAASRPGCDRFTSRTHPQQLPREEEPSPEESPAIQAVLVSEPPAEFYNCQICMAACDSGKGWEACKDQCVPNATFHCENDTLGSMTTVQEYADFIALFGQACPTASWTTHSVHWDGVTHMATFVCTYHCKHTQSVPGLGPMVPTQKTAHSPYCYTIQTDPARDNKIVHINKIWNDSWMLRDLGWTGNEEISHEEVTASATDRSTEHCTEGFSRSCTGDKSMKDNASGPTVLEYHGRKGIKDHSGKSLLRRFLSRRKPTKN